jgi:hypothetical protein
MLIVYSTKINLKYFRKTLGKIELKLVHLILVIRVII